MSAAVHPAPPPDGADAAPLPPPNPFVGPEPLDEGQPLHGRRRETEELSNLLVAKRIVLLFSPSGAGKTSLIRAGLLRKLQRAYDMQALPVVRLGYRDPDCIGDASVNRYRLAMLVALESRRCEAQRRCARELCGYTLQAYFQDCVFNSLECDAQGQRKYPLLIIDQFEELFVEPLDVPRKREFLAELGELLRGDPAGRRGSEGGASIWALFAIREDRAAALQPYLDFIPTSLAFRYRLDAMGVAAGREVIRETAKAPLTGESWVASDVPEVIVDDLSTVSVPDEDGHESLQPGPTLEPVQLQIVCRGLWDKVVRAEARAITVADVASRGHSEVDRALADFYDAEVAKAVDGTGVSERALREWIEAELISSSGVRTQCLYEPAMFGDDNRALHRLVDAHVLRMEKRAGRDWIELPHDRLVAPVREANCAWARTHLQPFQARARQWHAATGPYTRLLLLPEDELEAANAYARAHGQSVTDAELEFLAASKADVASRQKERRWRKLVLAAWACSGLVVLGLALAWGVNERTERNSERQERELAELRSKVYRDIAEANERSSSSAALAPLLALRTEVAAAPRGAPLLRTVDNAIRQQLTNSPAALVRELQPRKHVVWSLAFSGDGERLFAGSWDGHISGQDLAHPGEAAFVTPDLQSLTYAVVMHDASGLVASTHSDGRVVLWRANGTSLERMRVLTPQLANPKLTAAAISDDGRWLAAGGWGKRVDVWSLGDPRSPEHVASFRNGPTYIQSLAFVPGRDAGGVQRLATTDYDGSIRLWAIGAAMPAQPAPLRTLAIRDHFGADIGISASAVSPSGRWLVAGDTDGSLHLWDLTARSGANGIRFRRATHRGNVQDTAVKGVAFAPDSGGFVSVGLDGHLIRWTFPQQSADLRGLEKNTAIQRFRLPERLFSVAVRPHAPNQVAVGGTRLIYLLDLDRGPGPALSAPLPAAAGLKDWNGVSVNAAGTRIAARRQAGPIGVWQRDGGGIRAVPAWTVAADDSANFMLSPDGRRLVTVDCDGHPTEWTLRAGSPAQRSTPEPRARPDCSNRRPARLAFSPDGRWLATSDAHVLRLLARADGGAGPWSIVASRALLRPDIDDRDTPVGDLISAIAFSADSRRLAAGAYSGLVHLWDVAHASPGRAFAPVADVDTGVVVTALAFHPDGGSLRVGGTGGVVTRYDVPGLGNPAETFRHERSITGLQYASGAAGDAGWISADLDGYLLHWTRRPSAHNRAPGRIVPSELVRRGGAPLRAIALSRDGGLLVTAGEDLLAWDLRDDQVLKVAGSHAQRGYTPAADGASR